MCGAVGSMGRRALETIRPLPWRGRPNGLTMRPINPSPTARLSRAPEFDFIARVQLPVVTQQNAPMSSSSTLNAMPYNSANFSASSKPTPGRPETLAMPVAMLVIVPASRGASCGAKASRAWLSRERDPRHSSGCGWRAHFASAGAAGFGLAWVRALLRLDLLLGSRWVRLGLIRFSLRFRPGFGFRFRLCVQKFADALFQRREIIRDLQAHFCPFVVSSCRRPASAPSDGRGFQPRRSH